MSESQKKQRSELDAELEREIRDERKFTLAEAIGRLAGPGAMKGQSPVTRLQQAEYEITSWLSTHLTDAGGLGPVLRRDVQASELFLKNADQPLVVLAACLQQILGSDYQMQELVRRADTEWGQLMDERPYFEREGSPPPSRRSLHNRIGPSYLVGIAAATERGGQSKNVASVTSCSTK